MPGRQIAWRLIFDRFIGFAGRPFKVTLGTPLAPTW
jgi:hypothetical protein